MPLDYKAFLKFTNGFEGEVGNFVVSFVSSENVYKCTRENCSTFFPWAIYIGTNKNIEMFVIDTRHSPNQFGLLPFIGENSDFLPLGNTFEQFIHMLSTGKAFRSS